MNLELFLFIPFICLPSLYYFIIILRRLIFSLLNLKRSHQKVHFFINNSYLLGFQINLFLLTLNIVVKTLIILFFIVQIYICGWEIVSRVYIMKYTGFLIMHVFFNDILFDTSPVVQFLSLPWWKKLYYYFVPYQFELYYDRLFTFKILEPHYICLPSWVFLGCFIIFFILYLVELFCWLYMIFVFYLGSIYRFDLFNVQYIDDLVHYHSRYNEIIFLVCLIVGILI